NADKAAIKDLDKPICIGLRNCRLERIEPIGHRLLEPRGQSRIWIRCRCILEQNGERIAHRVEQRMVRHDVRDLPRDRQTEAESVEGGNHCRTFERVGITSPDPTGTTAVYFLLRADRLELD